MGERERPDRLAAVRWAAGIGAVTAGSLALLDGTSEASARGRLAAAVRRGLLERSRPLAAAPSLYTVTRGGLRASGCERLACASVAAGRAEHAIACAHAAAALARCFPEHRLAGEAELLAAARSDAASARAAAVPAVRGGSHRPDMLLLPRDGGRPLAVEVELTAKAPARLAAICRAWARCPEVAGVLYLTGTTKVAGAVARAAAASAAERRIAIMGLQDALAAGAGAAPLPAHHPPRAGIRPARASAPAAGSPRARLSAGSA
jgi:hypothetical protein